MARVEDVRCPDVALVPRGDGDVRRPGPPCGPCAAVTGVVREKCELSNVTNHIPDI